MLGGTGDWRAAAGEAGAADLSERHRLRCFARAASVLLALVAFSGRVFAADEATVALNFQDVELPVLAKFVSEVTGRNFIVDDRVRGKVTIISPTRITPDEAYVVFQSVLQVKGFTTVPSGSFVKIVPSRDARETTVPTGGQAGDQVVTRILPLEHAEAQNLVPVLQPLVSKDGLLTAYPATNSLVVVDAGANVERLAALLRQLDAEPAAGTLVVVPLRYAPADDVAKRLRETLGTDAAGHGLRVVGDIRTNSVVLSGPADDVRRARSVATRLDQQLPPGTSRVNVVRLKYADADGLARVLARLVGLPVESPPPARPHGSSLMRAEARRSRGAEMGYDGGIGEPPPAVTPVAATAEPATAAIPLEAPVRITADPASNALIVSATPEDWATLRGVIEQLDVRRRQVFVEAIILEATIERSRALGVEFQGGTSIGGERGLAQVNLGTLAGAAADPTSLPGLVLAAASNKTVRLPNGNEVPAHTVLLTALEQDSDVNVLSAPNLVTTDNEEAEIVVGRNVPFVASRATSATNLENLFTTIERHDVGITLRLTPQITADDWVHLTLFEEVSDIDPTRAAGDPNLVGPTTTVRSASTAVAARDGQTVVIGGLLSDTIRHTTRAVPYLGKVPVLGVLFRRNDDERVKTNLLVFLTPHVIASDKQMAVGSIEKRDRMRAAMPPELRNREPLTAPSWAPPSEPGRP
jgi:general secretion pathway protein D